jgi:hypothetical protein
VDGPLLQLLLFLKSESSELQQGNNRNHSTLRKPPEIVYSMAQFEIDIDLCLRDRRPFKIANASRVLRRCVMVSCLDELQWLSKYKLDLNPQAKVSMFLEKDLTKVDDQRFFEKIKDHTGFVAKEFPLSNDGDTKKISKYLTTEKGFKKIPIKRYSGDILKGNSQPIRRYSEKKKIGLKISGKVLST